ncbi:MAG: HAMP domain-containing histidine kinase [Phycisphaerae bacterium]|nr:HAMP domain-containing histidine kinase [Phycisphaerae bacterium]
MLAAAVILPTVCLLWFMNQAVKNERLAVRQKLIDAYKQQLKEISRETSKQYASLANRFIRDIQQSKTETEKPPVRLISNLVTISSGNHALTVYGADGQVEFPETEKNHIEPEIDSEELRTIWNVEFVTKDYGTATKLYGKVAEGTQDNTLRYKAIMAKARCLAKNGQYSDAIKECEFLFNAFPTTSIERDAFILPPDILINNYIMLIELYSKTHQNYDDLTDGLLTAISNSPWPLSIREFGLEKLKLFTENGKTIKNESRHALYSRLYGDILAERQSLAVAERFPKISKFGQWEANTIQKIEMPQPTYVFFFEDDGHKYVLSGPPSLLFRFTHPFEESFICRISDNTGKTYKIVDYPREYELSEQSEYSVETLKTVIGDNKPLLSVPIGDTFPGWMIELYPKKSNIFDNAANRQNTVNIWTGALVILLCILSGGVAIRAVNQQIKMNRLKNDFIATVTHELKTPLASMRLLVDTLLEGNYKDENTATEYLQMVANENKRLTHLIDSFLTFSRMERNKQVFDFQPIDPSEITTAAAEAIQAKFQRSTGFQPVKNMGKMPMPHHCRFTCTIAENLPTVNVDKDAMVTVLVNLLDNAYKYTNSDKHIELKVYKDNGFVCFAVKDNGIGLSTRTQRRIFNRFYQVDSRLSRRSEGCGLGLSIVKFIVDAHNGRIEVQSEPGQGSLFTVKLPAL